MSQPPSYPPPPPGGLPPYPPPSGPASGQPPTGGGDPPWPGGGVRDGASAAEAFPVPFSVGEGFVFALWILVAQFVVVLPAVLLGVVDPLEGGAGLMLVLVVGQVVALATILGFLAARGRLSWRLLGPRRPQAWHVGIGVAAGVGGFLAVNVLVLTLRALFGPVDPPEQQVLSELAAGGLTTLFAVVAAVVMAPLLEEVVFRGVLFQAMKRRTGLWPAAIVTSLLFAIVHVEVSQPIYSSAFVLLGLAFAWLMHRTGSLVVPIVGHATFNAISVGLTIVGARVLDGI
jgi:uncharacterized protein